MSELLDFYNINWVDGMKVSGKHFLESDLMQEARSKDLAGLLVAGNRYGLIPVPGVEFSTDSFYVKQEQDAISLELRSLHAITPDGTRIEIDAVAGVEKEVLTTNGLVDGKTHYLVASVNWRKKAPFGEPRRDELPIRIPYLKPLVKLSLVTEEVLKINRVSQNYIPFSKGVWKDKYFEIIEDYIPPCTSFQSHYRLSQLFAFLSANISNCEVCITQLLQKLNSIKYHSSLAKSLRYVANLVFPKIISINATIRIQADELFPHELAICFYELVKTCRIGMDTLGGKEKKEYLENLSKWTGLSPGDYEETLLEAENLLYRHYDSNEFWIGIKWFAEFHFNFFDKVLKEQDFKQMKDPDLFVAEKYEEDHQDNDSYLVETPTKKKRGWSFTMF